MLTVTGAGALADVAFTRSGAVLSTAVVPGSTGARMQVTIQTSATELETTQLMYFALLPNGTLLFRAPSGWVPYAGGAAPALFSHAQSECRSGASFGYHVDFPGIPDLSILTQTGLGGATFFAAYGDSQDDMLANAKFAPIYTVPRR